MKNTNTSQYLILVFFCHIQGEFHCFTSTKRAYWVVFSYPADLKLLIIPNIWFWNVLLKHFDLHENSALTSQQQSKLLHLDFHLRQSKSGLKVCLCEGHWSNLVLLRETLTERNILWIPNSERLKSQFVCCLNACVLSLLRSHDLKKRGRLLQEDISPSVKDVFLNEELNLPHQTKHSDRDVQFVCTHLLFN